MTVNGRFTLRGVPEIPQGVADTITSFFDNQVRNGLNQALEQIPSELKVAAIRELKLGFGDSPEVDIPETRTSQNMVVTLDMDNTAAAQAFKDNLGLVNMMMSLFETAVVPPGTGISLPDDPLEIDGTKGM